MFGAVVVDRVGRLGGRQTVLVDTSALRDRESLESVLTGSGAGEGGLRLVRVRRAGTADVAKGGLAGGEQGGVERVREQGGAVAISTWLGGDGGTGGGEEGGGGRDIRKLLLCGGEGELTDGYRGYGDEADGSWMYLGGQRTHQNTHGGTRDSHLGLQ